MAQRDQAATVSWQSAQPFPQEAAREAVAARIWAALATVHEPELGLAITDLGLVYGVDVRPERIVVKLTTTSRHSPLVRLLRDDAARAVRRALDGTVAVDVDVVFEPAWTPARMAPGVRSRLGWR